jgi:hypothetical protein
VPQDLDQIERVRDARVVAPVRRVDVRLDRRAVKRAVGKAVDDRDVQAFTIEERSERPQVVAREELAGLTRRQPKPESERLGRREPRLERRGDALKIGEDRRPTVARMDVGAVGEVEEAVRVETQSELSRSHRLGFDRRPDPELR